MDSGLSRIFLFLRMGFNSLFVEIGGIGGSFIYLPSSRAPAKRSSFWIASACGLANDAKGSLTKRGLTVKEFNPNKNLTRRFGGSGVFIRLSS
jgi:hypothetical protein